jgi:hypothetical protein
VQTKHAEAIRSLLEQDAATTGRAHAYGPAAESERTIFECFNAADAMISDVSSVVNDFLYTGKPLAMVAVSAAADRFAEEFPVSRVAYVIDAHTKKLVGLDASLDELLKIDSLAAERRGMKSYYLGDFEPEERFLAVASKYL